MNTANPNDHFHTDKRVAVRRRWSLKQKGIRSTVTKFRTEKGVFYRLRVHKEK
jgi:hypothetical protein